MGRDSVRNLIDFLPLFEAHFLVHPSLRILIMVLSNWRVLNRPILLHPAMEIRFISEIDTLLHALQVWEVALSEVLLLE